MIKIGNKERKNLIDKLQIHRFDSHLFETFYPLVTEIRIYNYKMIAIRKIMIDLGMIKVIKS